MMKCECEYVDGKVTGLCGAHARLYSDGVAAETLRLQRQLDLHDASLQKWNAFYYRLENIFRTLRPRIWQIIVDARQMEQTS